MYMILCKIAGDVHTDLAEIPVLAEPAVLIGLVKDKITH